MNHKISIVGMGYVGCGNALMFAKKNLVSIVDIDHQKVKDFNLGKLPITDQYAQKYFSEKNLNISATTDVSCFGGNDGTATVSTGNAFPGFTYLWNDGNSQTTNPATGLAQGNYIVTVTDTLGCVMTANTTINEPTQLTINFAPSDNLCPDSCAGTISSGASGGTFPYTHSWNDPNAQVTGTATGLCSGTYTLILKDFLNCTITDSSTIVDPPVMTLNPTAAAASCNQSDGSVDVSVTANGLAPFTYSWSDGISVVGSTSIVNGLPAATYFATVTDSNGCSVTDTVTIPNLSGPVLTIDSSYNVQCFNGTDGYAEVSVTGGVFPYTYLWNDPTAQATPSASNLTAGPYTITVTDSNGCVASSAIIISEPTELVLTAGGTDPSCFTYTDGSTWVNAFGGTPGYTYSWNDPGTQATDTATALGDGTYTVTVIDSNLCFDTISVILIDPLLFSVNVTGNDVTCFGACDGEAMTALTNGIAPFTYLWDDPAIQTTDSIFGLCDTTASVIVTDDMGCIALGNILITQPPLLVVTEDTLSHVDVDCFGNATGSANLTVTGGTGAYSFDWTLGGVTIATGQNANSLIAGSYLVTVTDANGCFEDINIIITENNPLLANATPSDADCFGASTGSAFVSPLGGTGAGTYTYLWTDIAQQQTDTAFNVIAGTYDVTVTDSNNCTVTVTGVVVGEPTQLVLNTTTVSSTCGANNGSATVNVGGGSFPYSYAWNTIPAQATPTADSIVAGNYVIIVTDNNNCVDSTTANVTDLGGPTVTIPTSTNVGCNGAGDGTAQSNVTGGIAPYSYVWNTGLLADTLANVTGLDAQVYSVTITDSNGCIASASVTIVENSGVSAVINTSTDVSCFGGNDGDASVSPAGGAGGTYTYSWNIVGGAAAGATPTTAANSVLTANDYYVLVTDSNGCTVSDTVTITEPPLLAIAAFNVDSVTCNALSDGAVDVTFTGGTLGYTYVWTPNVSSGATAAGLPAGTYNVEVTDSKGCIKDSTYTVFEPAQLVIDTATVPSKCGNSDGEATVSITTGSTPGYTYSWNSPGSPTTANVTGLAASTYVVTVTDNNNCSVSQNVVVYNVPGPVIDSIIVTDITCFGDNNGTATVYSSGGINPLTYQWNDAALQTTQMASNLAGSPPLYTVIVTDDNGCTSPAGVAQVLEPTLLLPVINSPDTVCHGEAFQLFANASGGTNPYTNYSWTGGLVISSASQGPFLDTLTTTTSYDMQVTDVNGCAQSIEKTIYVTAPLVLTATGDEICQGDVATLTATGSGGSPTGTLSYSWFVIDSLTLATSPTGVANPVNPLTVSPSDTTNYIVTLSDGCSIGATVGVAVIVNDTAINTLAPVADTCQGMPQVFSLTTTNGVTFAWDFDNNGLTDASTSNTNTQFTYPYAGTYDVTVITTTAQGCVSTMTATGWATANSNPIADFTTEPSPAIVTLLNPTFEFIDQTVANNNFASFMWNFDDGTLDSLNLNPYHDYQDTGYYNVSLFVTNEFGCTDLIEKTVRVRPDFLFLIPNSFTPDGDGLNDYFSPGAMLGAADRDYTFYIFDRWGELIFEGHDLSDSWDGNFKAKQVPNGVYVWKIEITDIEGTSRKYHGHVNVLR